MRRRPEPLLFEVDRDLVVSAAERAIAVARQSGEVVSLGLVRRLLRVARTEPEFAIGEWFIDGRCGCLIGNLYGRQLVVDDLPEAEYRVGLEFDSALLGRLADADAERYLRAQTRGAIDHAVVRVRETA